MLRVISRLEDAAWAALRGLNGTFRFGEVHSAGQCVPWLIRALGARTRFGSTESRYRAARGVGHCAALRSGRVWMCDLSIQALVS